MTYRYKKAKVKFDRSLLKKKQDTEFASDLNAEYSSEQPYLYGMNRPN